MGIEKLDGMQTSRELRPDSNPEESGGGAAKGEQNNRRKQQPHS